jgi:hypothetical protein
MLAEANGGLLDLQQMNHGARELVYLDQRMRKAHAMSCRAGD